MFKTLLKTRLAAFGAYYSGAGRRRGGKKQAGSGRKVLYALLFLYCFAAFGGMFFGLFSVLAEAFAGTAYAWLYFVMYAIVSFALMFIGSVFTAKTQLFEARDNELLLAMPVPPRYILGSRMVALAIYNAVFQLRGDPGAGGVDHRGTCRRIRHLRLCGAASGAEPVHHGGDVPVCVAFVTADEPDARQKHHDAHPLGRVPRGVFRRDQPDEPVCHGAGRARRAARADAWRRVAAGLAGKGDDR